MVAVLALAEVKSGRVLWALVEELSTRVEYLLIERETRAVVGALLYTQVGSS